MSSDFEPAVSMYVPSHFIVFTYQNEKMNQFFPYTFTRDKCNEATKGSQSTDIARKVFRCQKSLLG